MSHGGTPKTSGKTPLRACRNQPGKHLISRMCCKPLGDERKSVKKSEDTSFLNKQSFCETAELELYLQPRSATI